jgi:hypothetical protein
MRIAGRGTGPGTLKSATPECHRRTRTKREGTAETLVSTRQERPQFPLRPYNSTLTSSAA